jgi:hypothetical protein
MSAHGQTTGWINSDRVAGRVKLRSTQVSCQVDGHAVVCELERPGPQRMRLVLSRGAARDLRDALTAALECP